MEDEPDERIRILQDELKAVTARRDELKVELDAQRALVGEMKEHVEDASALIQSWIEAFDMHLDETGKWGLRNWVAEHDDTVDRYNALVRKWNRYVGRFNAVVGQRDIGRPLQASVAQEATVRKLRKAGLSLRAIAAQTHLGFATVRTIVGKAEGTDRTGRKRAEIRRLELNRQRMADYRARKRSRDALPKRINQALATGADLVKRAKGLKD